MQAQKANSKDCLKVLPKQNNERRVEKKVAASFFITALTSGRAVFVLDELDSLTQSSKLEGGGNQGPGPCLFDIIFRKN